MASKTHKGKHFVPESYLKAWCDPACPENYEPYVWLFDKEGKSARKKAPSNIFKETDFYTVEKADGTRDLLATKGRNRAKALGVSVDLQQLGTVDDYVRFFANQPA